MPAGNGKWFFAFSVCKMLHCQKSSHQSFSVGQSCRFAHIGAAQQRRPTIYEMTSKNFPAI
jgi:hypothetical protein